MSDEYVLTCKADEIRSNTEEADVIDDGDIFY